MVQIPKSLIKAVLAVSLVGLALPLHAQDKPPGYSRRVIEVPHVAVPAMGRQRPDPNAPAKLCFWTSTAKATSFVQSGFCAASSGMTVGTPCRCNSSSVGRSDGKWLGKVILAPSSDGSTLLVR